MVSLPGVCMFCMVWAISASLQEHLTCHCLRIVHSLLIALKYGKVSASTTNSSLSSVYVNDCTDFLLAINVHSKIIGKK